MESLFLDKIPEMQDCDNMMYDNTVINESLEYYRKQDTLQELLNEFNETLNFIYER